MRNLFLITLLSLIHTFVYAGQPDYCLLSDGSEISESSCAVLINDHTVAEKEKKARSAKIVDPEDDLISCSRKTGEPIPDDDCFAMRRANSDTEKASGKDDYVQCKWANGNQMSLDICDSQLRLRSYEERKLVEEQIRNNPDGPRAKLRAIEQKKELERLQEELAQLEKERDKLKREHEQHNKECAKLGHRELNKSEKSIISKAVSDSLKDPESARFRWMMVSGQGNKEGHVGYYCALNNAKNGYGGYIGYTPFKAMITGFGTKQMKVLFVDLGGEDNDDLLSDCSKECYIDFRKAK